MRLVVIESPYAGDVEANVEFAKAAMLDCLRRGEAPLASHLLYTQMLDDLKPDERKLGIDAGLAWGAKADATVVYLDRGISRGMQYGIENAKAAGRPIEYRILDASLLQAMDSGITEESRRALDLLAAQAQELGTGY